MIRVVLPTQLRVLARVAGEVTLESASEPTIGSVIDALEARHPELCGTIRDLVTRRRRPYIRLFACERDVSHDTFDAPLPDAVARGAEPLLIVGAMSGG
jgi:molybdopterin converting factor small subunit